MQNSQNGTTSNKSLPEVKTDTNTIVMEECHDEVEEFSVKVVIVGDSGVGKSKLLMRYVHNEFTTDSKATVGVELSTKTYKVNNHIIKIHLWDTAGQERYKSITSAYYKGAKGAMVVYDITKLETFNHLEKWMKEIRELSDKKINLIMCGNKSDRKEERAIDTDKAREKAEEFGIPYMETSALDSSNVEEAFRMLLTKIYDTTIKTTIETIEKQEFETGKNVRIEEVNRKSSKKGCCS